VLRASNGMVLQTLTAGSGPNGVAFDGDSMWVANFDDANIMKFRVRDYKLLGTFPLSSLPGLVAFDGANVCVDRNGGRGVAKM